MLRIFIGWDSRFPEPADVLRHSLLQHASLPLDIRYLKLDELGLDRVHDPRASTEFTYSRFLVPHLCGFQGKAVFMDNDMLCFGDVKELDDLDMNGLALRVVKHDYQPGNTVKMYGCEQSSYPRKNWSSFMLMNCHHWRCQNLTPEYVKSAPGLALHQFGWCGDDRIGALPLEWNWLVGEYDYRQPVNNLHFTIGGPWDKAFSDCDYAELWQQELNQMLYADSTVSETLTLNDWSSRARAMLAFSSVILKGFIR